MKSKKKMIQFLINMIRHDFGFYNSIWKWNDLPSPINENYELLKSKLQEWEAKGHIKIFEQNGERMIEIISVPKE